MNLSHLASYEVLLEDNRIDQLIGKLKSQFGHSLLEQSEFVSFIQPAKAVNRKTEQGLTVASWIGEMAVFAVMSPNPRPYAKQVKIMTHGTVSLQDFLESDKARGHFVGVKDPALQIFQGVVRAHLETMKNLKEMN